jgi:dCTP deaminase
MGNVALMARARGSSHVDPALAKSEQLQSPYLAEMRRQQKHERYELPFGAELLLHPGALALVPTLEWVRIPANLIGEVTARSTWAREGLSIATATLIEPNYEGIITLELANLGQIPIALYPGLMIAQIAFSEVIGDESRVDKGQFKGSFSPWQGELAKPSELPFLPDKFEALVKRKE